MNLRKYGAVGMLKFGGIAKCSIVLPVNVERSKQFWQTESPVWLYWSVLPAVFALLGWRLAQRPFAVLVIPMQ